MIRPSAYISGDPQHVDLMGSGRADETRLRQNASRPNGTPTPNFMMLPNHRSAEAEDPLDIVGSNTARVNAWRYVETALCRSDTIEEALDLLWPETSDEGGFAMREPDCIGLQRFFQTEEGANFRLDRGEWTRLRNFALTLPANFPDGVLDILHPGEQKTLQFTRMQIACLVANQALCALSVKRPAAQATPHWNAWWCNFGLWYQDNNHQCQNYLKSLFSYLKRVASEKGLDAPRRPVSFTRVRHSDDIAVWQRCEAPLGSLVLTRERPQAFAGKPGFAQVDFANKDLGFGLTQTQEELMMGHNPELCVSMLLAPTLRDDEAIIVRGTEVEGDYTRENGTLAWQPFAQAQSGDTDWACHEIIAIDALELDSMAQGSRQDGDALIDLDPANLLREINKAYIGFSAARSATIVTGLWGCGSFGGAAQVKTLIQWIAAARAGKGLVFNTPPGFPGVSSRFERGLAALTAQVRKSQRTAADVLSILIDPSTIPRNAEPESIFERVLEAIDKRESVSRVGQWLGRKALLSLTLPAGFKDPGYGRTGQWGEAGAGVMMLDATRRKVLLFKRAAETNRGGLWSIPGGARPVRAGQLAPALNTAVTELREEAPPLPEGQLWSDPFEYQDTESSFSYSTFFMTVSWPELYQPRINWEHSEYKWFELEELQGRDDLHPGVVDAVTAIPAILPERFNEVIPGLFVGNAASARNLELLTAHGIDHIINCAGEDCPNSHPTEIQYLTLALRDEPESKITPLIEHTTATIGRALDAGRKVLVHCEMGRSRSVSMVMAYLIAMGDAPRQALNKIRERHPDAAPNRWFLDELSAYYRRLLEEGARPDAD